MDIVNVKEYTFLSNKTASDDFKKHLDKSIIYGKYPVMKVYLFNKVKTLSQKEDWL